MKRTTRNNKNGLRTAAIITASAVVGILTATGVRAEGVFADELSNGTRNLETGYVTCTEGYEWNESSQTCEVQTESAQVCADGYELSQDGQRCVAPTIIQVGE